MHAFYSAKDIPGENTFGAPLPFLENIEEIFVGVDSEIKYFGQPIGIVLAETMALANYAATKVQIIYVDNEHALPNYGLVIPTIKDAMTLNATDRFQDSGVKKPASQHGTF